MPRQTRLSQAPPCDEASVVVYLALEAGEEPGRAADIHAELVQPRDGRRSARAAVHAQQTAW